MQQSVNEKIRILSEKYISPVAENLGFDDDFPWEIWKALGDLGVLGLGVSKEFGGFASSSREICSALYELVLSGGNLGLGLSAMIHILVSGYVISRYADDPIKKKILPLLASGTSTCSFAVSEPGRGGHPKFIETRAEKNKSDAGNVFYSITGEKTYLTNGPVADYFVVIAVTDEPSVKVVGRKNFSAFLVTSDKDGFEKTPQMKVPFFKPSPHGGIRLTCYKSGLSDIIGIPGKAYDDIVLPFRDVENCLMSGPVSGAMKRVVKESLKIAASVAKLSKEAMIILSRMDAVADLARDMAFKMADAFDLDIPKIDQQRYYFQFREICLVFNSLINSWSEYIESETVLMDNHMVFVILKNDLLKSAGLGDFILKANLAKAGAGMIGSVS